jgi:hypothetical protein
VLRECWVILPDPERMGRIPVRSGHKNLSHLPACLYWEAVMVSVVLRKSKPFCPTPLGKELQNIKLTPQQQDSP